MYPSTGLGYWFYTGNTAAEYNKVSWLLKYGMGKLGLGNTIRDVMRSLAIRVCPTFPNQTSCTTCADPGDLSICCCHGSGYNMGVQIVDVARFKRISLDAAIDLVAQYYINGSFGQEDARRMYPYVRDCKFCL